MRMCKRRDAHDHGTIVGLAKQSVSFCCPRCGQTSALLPEPKEGKEAKETKPRFAKEIEKLQMLQAENEMKNKINKNEETSSEKQGEKTAQDEVAPLVNETAEPEVTAASSPTLAAVRTTTSTNDTVPATAAEQLANTETEETPEEFTDAMEPEPAPKAIDWSFCTDRFANNCIAIMSLLLYLLWRKAYAIYKEIQEINQELQQPL